MDVCVVLGMELGIESAKPFRVLLEREGAGRLKHGVLILEGLLLGICQRYAGHLMKG